MILRAAWVAPISCPPIRDALVEIERGRIVRVAAAAGEKLPRDVIDLGAVVLTPGLVNPHTHLELTCYADRIPVGDFWPWIGALVKLRAERGQAKREQAAARDGAMQSLAAGVTCVGDVSRCGSAWRVLREVPIRKVAFAELLALADQPPRTIAELRAAVEEVQADELLTAGVSPHAPYTVPLEQIRAAVEWAAAAGRPWCVHWAETPEEIAYLGGRGGGLPMMLADRQRLAGMGSPNESLAACTRRCFEGVRGGALIHCNYLDDETLEFIAGSGLAVVFCPRAHHFFGHEAHPFLRLRAAGVRVAVGTDSRASNWSLSPLEELRHLAMHVAVGLRADELLSLVTIHAAAALGLEQKIGTIERGKAADLAAFPCDADTADPLVDLVCDCPAASAVWVAGERVI